MKKLALLFVVLLCSLTTIAQPRPYEIDESFVPSLDFMQKSWSGEFDGLDPNARMILSIKRTLLLNPDMTFTNEVTGRVKDAPAILLMKESGTYQYSSDDQMVVYTIEADSTLDMRKYLQGGEVNYAVNHYGPAVAPKTNSEKAQFTAAADDANRQWVLFDQQLLSPIDQRQKAVYVMTGTEIDASSVQSVPFQRDRGDAVCYDLGGRRLKAPARGITIVNGMKKIFHTGR